MPICNPSIDGGQTMLALAATAVIVVESEVNGPKLASRRPEIRTQRCPSTAFSSSVLLPPNVCVCSDGSPRCASPSLHVWSSGGVHHHHNMVSVPSNGSLLSGSSLPPTAAQVLFAARGPTLSNPESGGITRDASKTWTATHTCFSSRRIRDKRASSKLCASRQI